MQERITHWAVVFLGATLLGMCAWMLGFTKPAPQSSAAGNSTPRSQAKAAPFRPAGTIRPLAGQQSAVLASHPQFKSALRKPVVPWQSAGPAAPSAVRAAAPPRHSGGTRLPSADAVPAVIGDSIMRPTPARRIERLPEVPSEPAAAEAPGSGEVNDSSAASPADRDDATPSPAAPVLPLDPTAAPSESGVDEEASSAPAPSDEIIMEPALIAPSVSRQYGEQNAASPATISLPAGSAAAQIRIATAVAQRADSEIRRGLGLAQRRAFFSGRAAIIEALRLIAEAQDAARGGVDHSQALALGLRALEESDDFIAKGGELEADLDVASIASGHRTPVVREQADVVLAPLAARRAYYTFAQEKLALAVELEPVGSMALFALGKMHTALAEQKSVIVPGAETKAMVFHQAAMLVSPENPLAANELGVLLARSGRYEEAREWLIHGARLAPLAATWHNLAVVHRQLGETKLAEAAGNESRLANRGQPVRPSSEPRPEVKWLDNKDFASQYTDANDNAPASARQVQGAAPAGGKHNAAAGSTSRK